MDGNGDGKVRFQEYLDFIRKQGYNHVPSNLFRLLDENNRGYLDFEECVTLFYTITCNRFVFCGGYNCKSHLMGLHFVCVECYRVLCSSCYRDTNFDHEHSTFLDNYDLLHTKPWEIRGLVLFSVINRVSHEPNELARFLTSAVKFRTSANLAEDNKLAITSGAATMEVLVTTARLYYNKSSVDIKRAAYEFFLSLDINNDGKVCLHGFLGFMRDKGQVKMGSSQFFKELDKDNNGTLEFMEVMALYYIIKSGRPFCGGCDEFIPGMYFTCSICFNNGNDLFCVCPNCFQGEHYRHEHAQFLDNYALLETKRMHGSNFTHSSQHKVTEPRN
ncbi:hypothetical protein RHSIM_Rhsim02G0044800 [Rhododendron simsii]|uniref:EF-hand domain-containing protein n=1 Tax=Rhododendron simsii TaxID=118357 RepID=A0A834HAJ7_RHOSS|nr:hypothetical protein RHSIM_Rhsim02G0044800 [Rhododendron simsii]